jgi:hypothetical protein
MAKLLYKPLGIACGVLGGIVASALFQRMWSMVSDADDAPQATDEHRSWGQVLPAAMLQGGVYALVKAIVDRGGASGFKRLTGIWPD